MPALPVAEHRAPCAWPIREQDGKARSEPAVLPATHEPSKLLELKLTAVAVLLPGSIHAVSSTCVSGLSGTLQQPQTAQSLIYEKLRMGGADL